MASLQRGRGREEDVLQIEDRGLTRPAGLALRATYGSLTRSARLWMEEEDGSEEIDD